MTEKHNNNNLNIDEFLDEDYIFTANYQQRFKSVFDHSDSAPRQVFADEINDNNYRILNEDEFIDQPCLNLKVNRKNYRALKIVNRESFAFMNFLNVSEMITKVIHEFDKEVNSLSNVVEKVYELKIYEKDLIDAGGDGYERIFNKELRELFESCDQNFLSIMPLISQRIEESFFSYGESIIQDLSMVNNVRKYFWDYNVDLFSSRRINAIAHSQGQNSSSSYSRKIFIIINRSIFLKWLLKNDFAKWNNENDLKILGWNI